MADMSKITPEHIEQAEENLKATPPVKQDGVKDVLKNDFEFEINFPSMTTPFWVVVMGGFLLLTAGGKDSTTELIVGGSLVALGGLLEFVDRRWRKGLKIPR
jgi:hypothetical protein